MTSAGPFQHKLPFDSMNLARTAHRRSLNMGICIEALEEFISVLLRVSQVNILGQ